ncbi:Sugar transferase involved in LPS biosynthesis (colanic, teichoic acid) [Ruminococcus flavefaciens]|uniref:Sugar transferase involved in LPS biosynthesis (Colanic, teichoic acid) n=1 Tax=Ruminococcus flavefaciens TaxID=1265 RepID=A0A1H6JQV8_RUMFL|nr:sugar transferase [Ruminococcus flavefaciens]SEH64531.1 Sugar transferase involved in LPS biosynthesis (colanic, teichoic acid) [Ruminococcus flavefaciens]
MKVLKVLIKVIEVIIALASFAAAIAFIGERIDEIKYKGARFFRKPTGIYERFIKRPLDCFLSCGAAIVLSPVLLYLIIAGAINMKGNPFFTQDRPGRIDPITGKERIFKLIKFRSMTNEKDENGNLLPDEKRLKLYGKKLRASSLDELGELFNIIKGDMAVVGPRPQLVRDMVFMTDEQRKRHMVRQGLTGLAQCNGRNGLAWDDKLQYDIDYIENGITFIGDVKIIYKTVEKVFKKEGITMDNMATAADYGDYLLSEGRVSESEYAQKQQEAKEYVMG